MSRPSRASARRSPSPPPRPSSSRRAATRPRPRRRPPTPVAVAVGGTVADPGRLGRCRRRLRRDQRAGPRDPRPRREEADRADDRLASGAVDRHPHDLRPGLPAGPGRCGRTALQGPRADPDGRRPRGRSSSTSSRARSPASTTPSPTRLYVALEGRRRRSPSRRSTTPTSTTTPCRTRLRPRGDHQTVSRTRPTGSSPAQAIVEGDAYVADDVLAPAAPEPGRDRRGRPGGRSDPELQAALDRIPAIVQAQILFCRVPQGTQFVAADRSWPVAGRPSMRSSATCPPRPSRSCIPRSTTSRRGADRGRPAGRPGVATWARAGRSCRRTPSASTRPRSGWAPRRSPQRSDAAAGWGGDRIAVLGGPNDAWAIAWQTAWDTAADAAEFEVTADAAVAKARRPGLGPPR